jgi:RimJ/RimL family protein N-acetyltransferase
MGIALRPNPQFKPPKGVSFSVLGVADIPLLVAHLTGLDPQARKDRFNGGESTEVIADYAQRCIQPGVLVIAARKDGDIIGVGELHPSSINVAEAAFSIDADWRGKGIGTALFALILEAAWSRGLSEMDVSTHPGNEAMKKLARKFGAEMRFSGGDGFGRIDLDDIRMQAN